MAIPRLSANKLLLSEADLSVSQTTEVMDLHDYLGCGYTVVWSGGTGTAGNIIVEVTNDLVFENPSPTYTTLATTAVTTTSGSAISGNLFAAAAFAYMRLRWVPSAGTGGIITVRGSLKSYR